MNILFNAKKQNKITTNFLVQNKNKTKTKKNKKKNRRKPYPSKTQCNSHPKGFQRYPRVEKIETNVGDFRRIIMAA